MKASPYPPVPGPASWASRSAWLLALVALVATAILGGRLYSLTTEKQLAATELELAHAESQMLQQQLEAERIISSREISGLRATLDDTPLTILTLSPPARTNTASGSLVWLPRSQKARIVAAQLPEPAAGKVLRLWLVDVDGRPVPAGTLPGGSIGQPGQVATAEETLGAISGALITLEDGAIQPSTPGEIVLSGSK